MDGLSVIAIAGTVAGFSIPTYYALSKIYYNLGNHEARLDSIESTIEDKGKILHGLSLKIDNMNGNLTGCAKKSKK